jgi:uncharacterized membrane protein YfcA
MQFDFAGWTALAGAAIAAGISKTGVPGLGILSVPLAALALPAKESTGLLLPLLSAGDVGAVGLNFRGARWGIVLRLLPWTFLGVVAGYFAMGRIPDAAFKPLLGGLIIALLALDLVRTRKGIELPQGNKAAAAAAGILAGFCTMLANAAGPLMTIYLLAMGFSKEDFIGTQAWFFLIVNLVKWPFSLKLGLITAESLRVDLWLLPAVAVGEATGYFLLKKLPQNAFNAVARILAALGGIKLFF